MNKDFAILSDIELYDMMRGSAEIAHPAFAELYNRHSKRIFAYCKRILTNQEQVEDIFQDTFVNFFESAKKEREMTNVPAFLLRIARNLCLRYKRDNKQKLLNFEDLDLGFIDNKVENEELANVIALSLDLLPDEHREALVLQVYNEFSYNEISEFLEVPVTTVRNWIVRAKKKLREILAPYIINN